MRAKRRQDGKTLRKTSRTNARNHVGLHNYNRKTVYMKNRIKTVHVSVEVHRALAHIAIESGTTKELLVDEILRDYLKTRGVDTPEGKPGQDPRRARKFAKPKH